MKKILLLVMFMGSYLFATLGDVGSEVAIDEIKLKVELVKDDNTTVTILDGTEYLKLNGSSSSSTSIGQALAGTKPPAGTYTHIKWTPQGFRIKAKIVKSGVTYYTKNITVPEDDTTPWELTQDQVDYNSTTITQGAVTNTVTVEFPNPLVVTENKAIDLFYISKFTGAVDYSQTLPDVTWISNTMEAFSFTINTPAKIAQFDLVYNKGGTDYKNKISLLFDENDNLLGAHSSEGIGSANRALSGGFIKKAVTTTNGYNITTDGEGFPQVVSFDFNLSNCNNSTTYSNLTVDRWQSSNPDLTGGTLTTTGTVTCSDINITQ